MRETRAAGLVEDRAVAAQQPAILAEVGVEVLGFLGGVLDAPGPYLFLRLEMPDRSSPRLSSWPAQNSPRAHLT